MMSAIMRLLHYVRNDNMGNANTQGIDGLSQDPYLEGQWISKQSHSYLRSKNTNLIN